jgi:hypothetical protein
MRDFCSGYLAKAIVYKANFLEGALTSNGHILHSTKELKSKKKKKSKAIPL